MAWAETMMAALFPARCPGCGRQAEPVCEACARRLRAAPVQEPPPGLDAFVAAFRYEGVARELIARVKYRNERAALAWFAAAMADALTRLATADAHGGVGEATGRRAVEGAVITWVPASPARRRGRGFDHGELLARAVGRRLGRPVRRLLVRAPGSPQTGASRVARQDGPPLRFGAPPPAPGAVLVVDDVCTTGASLATAAAVLRRAGTRRVVGVTATLTPPP